MGPYASEAEEYCRQRFCARAANRMVEAAVEKARVGLAEESRWVLELKNADEQVDFRGRVVEKIDMTRNLRISGTRLRDGGE